MSSKKQLLFGILTGALLAASFPPMPFSFLAFIAFVPLLFSIEQAPQMRKRFLTAYLAFFVYHFATSWWLSSWQPHCDPYLLYSGLVLAVVHPFFFLIPIYAHFYFRRKLGTSLALWLFPFMWVAFEWLHSIGDLAFPWLTIGYTQSYNRYWVQFIDITGVWGASFVIVFINILILKIILHLKDNKSEDIQKFNFLKINGVKYKLFIIILLFVIPFIYGIIRVNQFNHNDLLKANPHLNIGIIQPNIDPWEKWSSNTISMIRLNQRIQDSLTLAVGKLDLAIWSETQIPFISWNFNQKHNFTFLQDWIDNKQTSLLTGFADYYIYPPNSKPSATAHSMPGDSLTYYDAFNSALILNPEMRSNESQIYHKMRLTPFGERIPYVELFLFLRKYFEWGVGISSWEKGNNQHNLTFQYQGKSAKIGAIICIESIYPGFCRNFTNQGANLLTIITNDAWYDHTFGPEQHFQIAAMRAIENRRYIARCANSGVSGFISPTGEGLYRAPKHKSVGIAQSVPLLKTQTFYTIYGDWIAYMSVIIVTLSLIYTIIKRSGSIK